MALTETQRAQIRRYLGWPALFRSTQNRLEQSMNAVAAWPETQTQVVADLAGCIDRETRITDALTRLQAKAVGSIRLEATEEIGELRRQGRAYAQSIGKTLGVDLIGGGWFGGGAAGVTNNYVRHG